MEMCVKTSHQKNKRSREAGLEKNKAVVSTAQLSTAQHRRGRYSRGFQPAVGSFALDNVECWLGTACCVHTIMQHCVSWGHTLSRPMGCVPPQQVYLHAAWPVGVITGMACAVELVALQ